MRWLDAVREALDQDARPLRLFFRDDDGGWDDGALYRLLDLFERHDAPLDVAVIPAAVTDSLAVQLRRRFRSARLGLHQHGYTHTNHQRAGRKAEFGGDRPFEQQLIDVRAGQLLLQARLGDIMDPIFTPPWNRCSTATGDVIARRGFQVLSRDQSAGRLGRAGLREVPVSVDWSKQRDGRRLGAAERGRLLADAARRDESAGVMLHHAVMDDASFAALDAFLSVVTRHPRARLTRMLDMPGVGGA